MKYIQFSEKGPRMNNEDCLNIVEIADKRTLFVVCDGMGGHSCGEVASKTVCDSFSAYWQEHPDTFDSVQKVEDAAKAASQAIDEKSGYYKMGTTLVMASIEGKEGIVINGGNIDVQTPDDAINANATIEFNGAHVMAYSTGNDAVDSNPKGGFFPPFGSNKQSDEPAIVIRGGTVYAWSAVGSPEEGLDCDFAALVIEGGSVFSVGGGMGEMPSVPTNETAKQPTALLIGLHVVKDEPIHIYDADGKLLNSVTIPFSLRRSANLITTPAFKVGGRYTVKTKDFEKTFTLDENFTTIR